MRIFVYVAVGLLFFFLSLISRNSILNSFFIGIVCSCGFYAIRRIRIKRQKEVIEKSYEMELPDLMIHIAMFVEAGLGVKEAVRRSVMAGDIRKPLYRDLNGVFERERKIGSKDFIVLLEEFAQMRKSPALSSFSAIIIQNIRKGSDELGEIFTSQAQIYRNERRRIASKLADEAATLLLIPSTIVLVALVLLLLAPAIMAFMQVM